MIRLGMSAIRFLSTLGSVSFQHAALADSSLQLVNGLDLHLVNLLSQDGPEIPDGIQVRTVRRPGLEELDLLLLDELLGQFGCVTSCSILLEDKVRGIWEELRREDVVRDSCLLDVVEDRIQDSFCVKLRVKRRFLALHQKPDSSCGRTVTGESLQEL